MQLINGFTRVHRLLPLHIYWNMTLSCILSRSAAKIQIAAFICLKTIVQTVYSATHLSCD